MARGTCSDTFPAYVNSGCASLEGLTGIEQGPTAILAIAECAGSGALRFIYQETPLSLNLHVNAATSGVDINAFLCGGKADYHTGRI